MKLTKVRGEGVGVEAETRMRLCIAIMQLQPFPHGFLSSPSLTANSLVQLAGLLLMSDSIIIIGLAASVVQIVDVTGRLIARSCGIYQSAEDAFRENHELEGIITDLQITNAKVANITLQFGKDDRLNADDRGIRQLCVGCNEVAGELLGAFSFEDRTR